MYIIQTFISPFNHFPGHLKTRETFWVFSVWEGNQVWCFQVTRAFLNSRKPESLIELIIEDNRKILKGDWMCFWHISLTRLPIPIDTLNSNTSKSHQKLRIKPVFSHMSIKPIFIVIISLSVVSNPQPLHGSRFSMFFCLTLLPSAPPWSSRCHNLL